MFISLSFPPVASCLCSPMFLFIKFPHIRIANKPKIVLLSSFSSIHGSDASPIRCLDRALICSANQPLPTRIPVAWLVRDWWLCDRSSTLPTLRPSRATKRCSLIIRHCIYRMLRLQHPLNLFTHKLFHTFLLSEAYLFGAFLRTIQRGMFRLWTSENSLAAVNLRWFRLHLTICHSIWRASLS